MNIKSLKKIVKVAAAMAMGVAMVGCATIRVGDPVKAEALQVETWENAQKIDLWRKKLNFNVYKPPGTSVVYFKIVDDVFGGGKWNYYWADVPPGTDPMPRAGDFIEISAGDGRTVDNTFRRILPADCGWRGGIPGIKSQRVGCDSDK